jgi:hypothetical protein
MNRSLLDVGGSALIVSQFTLGAETRSNRPGFSAATVPEDGERLYEHFMAQVREHDQREQDLPAVGFTGDYYHRAFKLEGEWTDYSGAVMSIDPSGRGQDETGYAVVKSLNSNLFVTAAGGLQGGYSDATLEKLAKIAMAQQVKLIIIESNFGDGMFMALFKPWLKKVG